jgi:hypothetical protein
VTGCCEFGSFLSGSVKCGEFLDLTRSCELFKKDCAAWLYLFIYLFIYLVSHIFLIVFYWGEWERQ